MEYILFFILGVFVEIIGTIAGFGSSIFFMPIALFFFDYKTVLALTGLQHIFSNAAKLIYFSRSINWDVTLRMGIPSILLVAIGALLSNQINVVLANIALGVFVIFISTLFLLKPDISLPLNKEGQIISGGIAGFLAGFIGTGGVVRGMALASVQLEKNIFVATSAAIDTGVDLLRSAIYLSNDFLPPNFYIVVPILILTAFIGSYIGKRILNVIPQRQFIRLVWFFLLTTGIIIIYKNISS